jgi:hypothetical protein
MYSGNKKQVGYQAAEIKRSQPSAAPTGEIGASAELGAIPHDETSLQPLAPPPQPSNINQTENMSQSPSS